MDVCVCVRMYVDVVLDLSRSTVSELLGSVGRNEPKLLPQMQQLH